MASQSVFSQSLFSRRFCLSALGLLATLTGAAHAQTSAPPLQVLPLGDSITHGYTAPTPTPGGYRAPLLDLLTAQGYSVQYVGANTANSSPGLDATGNSHHEGHSGFRIDQISNNLDGEDNSDIALGGEGDDGGYWLTGLPGVRPPLSPDLILLDIGANDYFTQYDPLAPGGNGGPEYQSDPLAFDAHAGARMDALLGKLIALRPQATILVASVLPAIYNTPVVSRFNTLLETRLVPKYQAQGAHLSFVDQNAGFLDPAIGAPIPSLYGADPVHPNAAGYRRMAQAWLHGVEAVRPPPVPEPTHTPLLWSGTDGRAIVWTMDAAGRLVTGRTYGPRPGWTPTSIAAGPDGTVRLLWTTPAGGVLLWNLSDADPAATGQSYGPYGDAGNGAWHATALAAAPDGTSRLLWNADDGQVALCSLDAAFRLVSYGRYGPYVEGAAANKWRAAAVSVGPDGICHLLWDNTNGRAAIWAIDDAGAVAVTAGYGPYSYAGQGLWHATGLAVAPDDTLRLLWGDAAGQAALWRVTPGGVLTVSGYGPYVGGAAANKWRASGISAGPDGICRLLWHNTNGRTALWNVNADGGFTVTGGYGPYPGLSPVGITAGP